MVQLIYVVSDGDVVHIVILEDDEVVEHVCLLINFKLRVYYTLTLVRRVLRIGKRIGSINYGVCERSP